MLFGWHGLIGILSNLHGKRHFDLSPSWTGVPQSAPSPTKFDVLFSQFVENASSASGLAATQPSSPVGTCTGPEILTVFLCKPRKRPPDGFIRGSTLHVPRRQAMVQLPDVVPERALFTEPCRARISFTPTFPKLQLQHRAVCSLQPADPKTAQKGHSTEHPKPSPSLLFVFSPLRLRFEDASRCRSEDQILGNLGLAGSLESHPLPGYQLQLQRGTSSQGIQLPLLFI